MSKTWIPVVDGWIEHGIIHLARNDVQHSIEMTLDRGVFAQPKMISTYKERPDYFLGQRDAIADYIEWKIENQHPDHVCTWIDPIEEGDEPEGEGGVFVISRKEGSGMKKSLEELRVEYLTGRTSNDQDEDSHLAEVNQEKAWELIAIAKELGFEGGNHGLKAVNFIHKFYNKIAGNPINSLTKDPFCAWEVSDLQCFIIDLARQHGHNPIKSYYELTGDDDRDASVTHDVEEAVKFLTKQ